MKLEKEVKILNYGLNEDNCGYDFLLLNPYYYFEENEKDFIIRNKAKRLKLTLEVEEPILDDAERKYLSGVIRPFRNRICSIVKEGYSNIEYIQIKYDKVGNINTYFSLPSFKVGTMYKGMELNKKYTLKELGL